MAALVTQAVAEAQAVQAVQAVLAVSDVYLLSAWLTVTVAQARQVAQAALTSV